MLYAASVTSSTGREQTAPPASTLGPPPEPPEDGSAQLSEQVFSTLRSWIINGQLPPGYHLRIRHLADAVGTSVMPVRDAVRRLIESGLAVHEPYKGATVRGLEISELEHAYDIRIMLESECARLGTKAGSASAAEEMDQHWRLLERAAKAGDVTEALHQDELLLGALYRASGNDILVDIISGLWDKCHPYKIVWASAASDQGDSSIWHYKPDLITAVRAGDSTGAGRIMRTSYREAKATIRKTLSRNADPDRVVLPPTKPR